MMEMPQEYINGRNNEYGDEEDERRNELVAFLQNVVWRLEAEMSSKLGMPEDPN